MNKIKAMRESAGMTQSLLSIRTGINIRQIQKYESGEYDIVKISLQNAIALADALCCDVKDLLGPESKYHIQVKEAVKKCEEKILEEYTPENYDVFNDQIKVPTEVYYKKMKEYMEELGFFEGDLLKCLPDKINMEYIENVAYGKEIHKIFITFLI